MFHSSRYLVVILSSAFLAGCTGSLNPNVTGSGVSASEQRTISKFTTVELYGVGTLTVNPSEHLGLRIEADDNMLQFVKSSVDAETLSVGVGAGTYTWNTGYPRIILQGGNAKKYDLRGQTQLVLNNAELDSLNIKLDGQCNVTLGGTVNHLDIEVSGQCSIDATNASIKSITGELNGQSTIVCRDAADVKVKKNKDSVITKADGN